MLVELVVATGMVALTVVVHGWGLSALGRMLRAEEAEERARPLPWVSVRGVVFMVAMVLGLFVLHGVEIWLYAALYHLLGAVPDLHTAVYFSTTTYATLGFGEAMIADEWRLVAGIEGINGVLLLGWSTAFFVTMMNRVRPRARPN